MIGKICPKCGKATFFETSFDRECSQCAKCSYKQRQIRCFVNPCPVVL